MGLPDVKISIRNGALGQVPPSNANVNLKIGICSLGIVGLFYSFGDMITAQATLGQGPLLEAVALALATGGGPVYAMPINPSVAGSNSAVTKTSPTGAAGTVAVGLAPGLTINLKIVLGGVNGTMTFQYSVGGAGYSATQASIGGTFTYAVPSTLTSAIFASGQTWVAADVYTINTDGTVVRTGSGPAATNVTHTDSPLDNYSPIITITTAGALGVAQFTYSLDGGLTQSGQILVPSSGTYVIPGTGVVVTFASTFGLADTFSWTTTTASYSTGDVTTTLTAVLANSAQWGFLHVVGMPSNAANAASMASAVDAQMTVAQTAYRFVRAIIECPTSESDSTIATAFVNFVSARVGVAVGTALTSSPLTGKQLHRPSAWSITARLSAVAISEEPSFVGRGPLAFVNGLTKGVDRDENATPFLDAARFMTLRYIPGIPGVFCTRGMMMDTPGGDYGRISRGRVMDVACSVTRAGLLPYLNGTVNVDTKTGFIAEPDARAIEATVTQKLKNSLVSNGNASGASVVLSRTANILSTLAEPVTVRVIPLAIIEEFDVDIGFSNPVLTAQLGLTF